MTRPSIGQAVSGLRNIPGTGTCLDFHGTVTEVDDRRMTVTFADGGTWTYYHRDKLSGDYFEVHTPETLARYEALALDHATRAQRTAAYQDRQAAVPGADVEKWTALAAESRAAEARFIEQAAAWATARAAMVRAA